MQPGMQNGRCKMHGGCFYKKEVHGRYTLRAKAERKQEHALLREMKALNKEIEQSQTKTRQEHKEYSGI